MRTQAGKKEKAPKTLNCRDCSRWKDIRKKLRVSELVNRVTEGLEERIKDNDLKATVGDYIRLLQLEKEIESEIDESRPKEIKVTWVEPSTPSESEK